MRYERYELNAEDDLMFYEFNSYGPKGEVTKLIEYTETKLKGFYNLGFGDKDPCTGKINDAVITDNGDSKKVLSTVASSVYKFTNNYPNAWVYAIGSTKARTRLYRIGIANNLTEIIQDFDIYGFKDGEWRKFVKNVEYEAFLVRRKSVNSYNE